MQLALLQAEIVQTGAAEFWLWFTFGGMLLATVLFLYWASTGQTGAHHHFVVTPVITLWAAMMYLVMAVGEGQTIILEEERLFYWARYVDWLITTPLLLLALAWVALGSLRRNQQVVLGIVVADVLMILTGLVAGVTTGAFKWFWFVISCVFFLAVLALIWGPLQSAARSGVSPEASLFYPLAVMLTVLWFLYPIVFLVGTEGVSAIGIGPEVFFFAVLDILAKIAFGIVLLSGVRRIRGGGRRSAAA
jgi:bacteriorhodopsin